MECGRVGERDNKQAEYIVDCREAEQDTANGYRQSGAENAYDRETEGCVHRGDNPPAVACRLTEIDGEEARDRNNQSANRSR